MQACFSFKEFQTIAPPTHATIIARLADKHFSPGTEKRRAKAEQNLDAIITATFRLAATIGFARMSMRDLHKESGLSLGGLYNYFESKEALALMITDGLHLIAFDWLPSLTNDSMNNTQQLERLVRGHIYLSETLRPWFYFVFMESKNLPESNKAAARDVELRFQARIAELLDNNTLLASHIMALVQDWHVKHWKYRNVRIDDFADSVVTLSTGCLPR